MQCPNCRSTQTRVADSRPRPDRIYRRRDCMDCKTSWRTFEIHADELDRLSQVDNNNEELCGLATYLYETYGPEAQPQFADTKYMIRPDRRRSA